MIFYTDNKEYLADKFGKGFKRGLDTGEDIYLVGLIVNGNTPHKNRLHLCDEIKPISDYPYNS